MSKKHRKLSIPEGEATARPVGGGTLTVSRPEPISIGIDGTIRVDISKLESPPHSYDADYAWIAAPRPGLVSMVFDKLSARGDKVRMRFEVRFADETFFDHFWGNSREFHERMRAYLDDSAMRDPGRADRVKELGALQPEKEHWVWASFDVMSHSGNHASADFYIMPTIGLARFVRGHGSDGLALHGVARVNLLTSELCSLLDEAAPFATAIEERRRTKEDRRPQGAPRPGQTESDEVPGGAEGGE